MLGAVCLQTPDKRLLKIQYFFNFKCRVPMFEDPGALYYYFYLLLYYFYYLPITLETRFLRADLIEVFKILRGFENLDPDRWLEMVLGGGAQF